MRLITSICRSMIGIGPLVNWVGTHSEPANALLQPPAHYIIYCTAHFDILPVQIRLTRQVKMQLLLFGFSSHCQADPEAINHNVSTQQNEVQLEKVLPPQHEVQLLGGW